MSQGDNRQSIFLRGNLMERNRAVHSTELCRIVGLVPSSGQHPAFPDHARVLSRRMMKQERTLFDECDDKAEARADARAEADVLEGRLISHSAVRRWLASWRSGKPRQRPRPGD